jgi:hypothetical protein
MVLSLDSIFKANSICPTGDILASQKCCLLFLEVVLLQNVNRQQLQSIISKIPNKIIKSKYLKN